MRIACSSILPLLSLGLLSLTGLSACGDAPSAGDAGLPKPLKAMVEPVQPAVPTAPYAGVLADCAFNASRQTSCLLSTLPFLGQDHGRVSVDQIMARVATSKPWMAQRLRDVLQTLPPELLQMTRSTTAILIGSKVRPSFYYSGTGAIYLDPDFLWLTPEERATIDLTPDARGAFGASLQFRSIWRYVIDNDYAYTYYPPSYTGSRTLEDTRLALGRLLAHELAHAGDFVPPQTLDTLPRTQTVEDAIDGQATQWISTRLRAAQPLSSTVWPALAQVLYKDQKTTAEQRSYSPAQAGSLLEPDRASDAYGYFTQFEDAAMLAEEVLGYCYYGMQRDWAVTDRPSSGDYTVGWGVRGRVAEPQVQSAARFVVQELLPAVALDDCFAALPAPVKLRAGATWRSNLDPSGTSTASSAKTAEPASIRPTDLLPPG